MEIFNLHQDDKYFPGSYHILIEAIDPFRRGTVFHPENLIKQRFN